jgi:hypothetical protein
LESDRGEPDEHRRRQSAFGGSPSSEPADLKLEAVVTPVADDDRSKVFYAGTAMTVKTIGGS